MEAPILKEFFGATSFLFAGHGRNVHARIPFYQAISQREKLAIPSLYAELEFSLLGNSVHLVLDKSTFRALLGIAYLKISCIFSRPVRPHDIQISFIIRNKPIVHETGQVSTLFLIWRFSCFASLKV
jgi:hypothetical protein